MVVVDAELGLVVVVLGAVVDVVARGEVVLVVELVVGLVVVEVVVAGGFEVVVVGVPGDDGVKTVALFAISSIAVTSPSARMKTMAAVPARVFQLNRRALPSPRAPAAVATPAPPVTPTTPAPSRTTVGCVGVVVAPSSCAGSSCPSRTTCSRSVAGTSAGAAPAAISVLSSPTAPTTSVGCGPVGPPSTEDVGPPAAPVAPIRRRRVDALPSGTRTAACLTAFCPRSIDCDTKVVPRVAAMEPIATPMIVPVTPKLDAMSAAITAPAAEARICRTENFTPTEETNAYEVGSSVAGSMALATNRVAPESRTRSCPSRAIGAAKRDTGASTVLPGAKDPAQDVHASHSPVAPSMSSRRKSACPL